MGLRERCDDDCLNCWVEQIDLVYPQARSAAMILHDFQKDRPQTSQSMSTLSFQVRPASSKLRVGIGSVQRDTGAGKDRSTSWQVNTCFARYKAELTSSTDAFFCALGIRRSFGRLYIGHKDPDDHTAVISGHV